MAAHAKTRLSGTSEIMPYGSRTITTVGGDNTPVWIYKPSRKHHKSDRSRFVVATGLLTTPQEYNFLGAGLAALGDEAYIFGYDHHHHRWPIRANAETIVSAVSELNLKDFVGVGHSMGTIALLLALENQYMQQNTKALVQIDPAMTGYHLLAYPSDMVNIGKEMTRLAAGHPKQAVGHLFSAVSEMAHRPEVILQQSVRLLSGKVHGRYKELMAKHHDLPVCVIYDKYDGLVPARWAPSLVGENIQVFVHDSPTLLGHAAITADPEYPIALHNIAKGHPLSQSFALAA